MVTHWSSILFLFSVLLFCRILVLVKLFKSISVFLFLTLEVDSTVSSHNTVAWFMLPRMIVLIIFSDCDVLFCEVDHVSSATKFSEGHE